MNAFAQRRSSFLKRASGGERVSGKCRVGYTIGRPGGRRLPVGGSRSAAPGRRLPVGGSRSAAPGRRLPVGGSRSAAPGRRLCAVCASLMHLDFLRWRDGGVNTAHTYTPRVRHEIVLLLRHQGVHPGAQKIRCVQEGGVRVVVRGPAVCAVQRQDRALLREGPRRRKTPGGLLQTARNRLPQVQRGLVQQALLVARLRASRHGHH